MSPGTSESASVAIGGPGCGYSGPTDIAVYYDVIYKTFSAPGGQSLEGATTIKTRTRGPYCVATANLLGVSRGGSVNLSTLTLTIF